MISVKGGRDLHLGWVAGAKRRVTEKGATGGPSESPGRSTGRDVTIGRAGGGGAAIVKQKREQAAAQDRWQPGTKVSLTGLRRAELNGAEGSVQGEENGRVLVQLDHQKGGRTVAVTHDHLSGLPPGNGSSRGSHEQASSPQTKRVGAKA